MTPNYAIITENTDGNPNYSFRVELREFNDDGFIARHELKASEVSFAGIQPYKPIDPLLLPLDILVELRRNLLKSLSITTG